VEGEGKMLAIIGTRPEAIKLAPVVKALDCDVLLTGQHPTGPLMDILRFFEVRTVIHEGQHGGSGSGLSEALASCMEVCDYFISREPPDIVICQGDTTSALAGALAAFHRGIPVAHVEAGLRTYNLESPFPEEANRQLISRLARWHFTPTGLATKALFAEPMNGCQVHQVGNTVVDALEWAADKIEPPAGEYVLCTVHRRENIPRIPGICAAIKRISGEIDVYVTVHPNPDVTAALEKGLAWLPSAYCFYSPGYADFLSMLSGARIVLTDSGGVQEEAAAFNKPCLVLRDNTERTEGIDAGCARLVGTDPDKIVAACQNLLTDAQAYASMAEAVNPYGDGHAAERIAKVLTEALNDGV